MLAVVAGLAVYYLAAAQAHATTVNTSKARADQSGYLWDAQRVWANWHGQRPPHLIGERNRMPLYAGFLALCYNPRLAGEDNLEFFATAKAWNIRLSLALLAVLWLAVAWRLPALLAANLVLVVGFGYFVFKAGYAQADLLYYTIFFLAFLAAWRLLTCRRPSGVLVSGAVFGILAGLAHLTKASAPAAGAHRAGGVCRGHRGTRRQGRASTTRQSPEGVRA